MSARAAKPQGGAADTAARQVLPVAAGAVLVALWAAAVEAHWPRFLIDCAFGWDSRGLGAEGG